MHCTLLQSKINLEFRGRNLFSTNVILLHNQVSQNKVLMPVEKAFSAQLRTENGGKTVFFPSSSGRALDTPSQIKKTKLLISCFYSKLSLANVTSILSAYN